jgi:hypothetical protein
MVTRQARLEDFPSGDARAADQVFDLLCEDHCGTYTLPFGCCWRDGGWRNAKTGKPIQAKVAGWRLRKK